MLGAILVLERTFKAKDWGCAYTFVMVAVLSLVFSFAPLGVGKAMNYIRLMFSGKITQGTDVLISQIKNYLPYLLPGFIAITPLPRQAFERWNRNIVFKLILLTVFCLAVYTVIMNGAGDYMYLRF